MYLIILVFIFCNELFVVWMVVVKILCFEFKLLKVYLCKYIISIMWWEEIDLYVIFYWIGFDWWMFCGEI